MNRARILAFILFVFLLKACASDVVPIAQLDTGMTRAQVEEVQGEPEKIESSGDYTALSYKPDFCVILENDRVIAFGRGTIGQYPGTDRYFINAN